MALPVNGEWNQTAQDTGVGALPHGKIIPPPVQAVFHRPVIAHECPQFLGRQAQVVAGVFLGVLADLSDALHPHHTLGPRPGVVCLPPGHIMKHRRDAGFDPSVIALNILVLRDRMVGPILRCLRLGAECDILTQAALIALERQHIVGLFIACCLRLRSECGLMPRANSARASSRLIRASCRLTCGSWPRAIRFCLPSQ